MKGLSILAAFLGGAAVGAACGILFAPETDSMVKSLRVWWTTLQKNLVP